MPLALNGPNPSFPLFPDSSAVGNAIGEQGRLDRCCIIIILLLRKGKPVLLLESKGGLVRCCIIIIIFFIGIILLLLGKGKPALPIKKRKKKENQLFPWKLVDVVLFLFYFILFYKNYYYSSSSSSSKRKTSSSLGKQGRVWLLLNYYYSSSWKISFSLENRGGLGRCCTIIILLLLLGKGKPVLQEGLDRCFIIYIPFPSPLTLTFFLRNSSPKLNSLLINPPLLSLSLSLSLSQLFNLAIKFFVILRGKVTPTRYFVSSISGLFTCIVGINLFLFPYLTISLFP